MAKTEKKKQKAITKISFTIDGEEKIKQFALVCAGGLQVRGMAVLEVLTDIKQQVKDQTDIEII